MYKWLVADLYITVSAQVVMRQMALSTTKRKIFLSVSSAALAGMMQ